MVAKLHNRLARARSAAIFLSVLLGFLFTLGQPAVVQAGMLLASGSYTGNGANNSSITGLGFQPDVVIIKGNNAQLTFIRTSTMTGDASKQLSSNPALVTNRIQSLDADGFTLCRLFHIQGPNRQPQDLGPIPSPTPRFFDLWRRNDHDRVGQMSRRGLSVYPGASVCVSFPGSDVDLTNFEFCHCHKSTRR